MVYFIISKKPMIFQGSKGVQHISGEGGSDLFQRGGVQLIIPMETYLNCDFRGVFSPCRPL